MPGTYEIVCLLILSEVDEVGAVSIHHINIGFTDMVV
jgi:hypothetical protein